MGVPNVEVTRKEIRCYSKQKVASSVPNKRISFHKKIFFRAFILRSIFEEEDNVDTVYLSLWIRTLKIRPIPLLEEPKTSQNTQIGLRACVIVLLCMFTRTANLDVSGWAFPLGDSRFVRFLPSIGSTCLCVFLATLYVGATGTNY